ncbi:O-antigen ligase family protein [Akkermansiaceae bacterium]|nr:O-antigen ligase family protein [Akkermansiaceae bacterium]
MPEVTLSKYSLKGGLALFLVVTYPIDQLYSSLVIDSSIPSPFKIIISCYIFRLFHRKYRFKRRGSRANLVALFLLTVWSFITIIWALESYTSGLKDALQLLVLWSFTVVAIDDLSKDRGAIQKIIFYWMIIGAAFSLLALSGVFSAEISSNYGRLSFVDLGINALAISQGYIFILALNSFSFFKGDKTQKIIAVCCLCSILLLLVNLGTRSVIWGLIFTAVVTSLIYFNTRRTIGVVILGLMFIFGYFYAVDAGLTGDRSTDRLQEFSYFTFSENSRTELFFTGFEWWKENLLGSGIGNERFAYLETGSLYLEAHNTFLSTLIQLGVPGLVLLIASFSFIFYEFLKIEEKHIKVLVFSLLLFFLIQLIKGSFLQTRLFWQPVMLIILMIESSKRGRLQA